MAITGSTRMQATSDPTVRDVDGVGNGRARFDGRVGQRTREPKETGRWLDRSPSRQPNLFWRKLVLEEMHAVLRSSQVIAQLAKLVELEESVYRSGHKNNYFADRFAIDVLTDTTERSPTYCTPPFRKFDDTTATESWAFLFLPQAETPECLAAHFKTRTALRRME